jgi:hypothetical protein
MSVLRRHLLPLVVVLAGGAGFAAAESPHQAFVKSWEGKDVIVKQPLYALVYNERGRLGNTYNARRDGLTVVTPNQGVFFQFDGRQGKDPVKDRDPQRILDAVNVTYQGDGLDVRSYRRLEALFIARYDAGAALVVRTVRVDRDIVRLGFAEATGPNGADDLVVTLTVKWPVPLSKSFSERGLIENQIHRFIDVKRGPAAN